MTFAMRVAGVGVIGPGLADWATTREILAGRTPYAFQPTVLPSPDVLPATERRRAGRSVRLALGAGLAAVRDAGCEARYLVSIFGSSGGDGDTLDAICDTLASDDRELSPTRFHNSVHNAPAGYWGIATGAMHASDTIAAFDATFAASLVEATARLATDPSQALLLVCYDAPYPEPLHAVRPILDAFGVGLVLTAGTAATGPRITVEISARPAEPMDDAALEAVRRAIPAARSLPLLACIARSEAGEASVEYLEGTSLRVRVLP